VNEGHQRDEVKWKEAVGMAKKYAGLYNQLEQELADCMSSLRSPRLIADQVAKAEVEKYQAEAVEAKEEKDEAVAEK
jgi:hypothetical protein